MSEKNSLVNYLDYYLKLTNPGFALLVTGEWGAGKTFQVLNNIPEAQQCHVSLFGINNPNEIHAAIFAKMFPKKSLVKKVGSMVGDASSELPGITLGTGAILSNLINVIIKDDVDHNKVIIFDDLERCPLSIEEIFGVINNYIEHQKCKVIVIAHDDKIEENFKNTKEKIIGHTIKIEPQVDLAAEHFFNETKKLTKSVIIKKSITDSFKKTNCNSLRILRYIIKDCERLIDCIRPTHLANDEAMHSLFSNFTIINTEYKAGNFSIDDIYSLEDIYDNYFFNKEELIKKQINEKALKIYNTFEKYNHNDIKQYAIPYQLTAKILEFGEYNEYDITLALNISKYFLLSSKNPAWLIIISYNHVDDSVLEDAVSELIDNFDNYNITETGELIHSYHSLFLLSQLRIIYDDYDSIEIKIKNYIDTLLIKGTLEPQNMITSPFDENIYEHSHGYGYLTSKEYLKNTDSISTYLQTKRRQALINKYPEFKETILNALENDIDYFKKLFLGYADSIGAFSQIDILSYIPVDDFIISWFMLPTKDLDKVTIVLNSRYRNSSNNLFASEKNWLYELCVSLKLEALTQEGFTRRRIERLIPYGAIRS